MQTEPARSGGLEWVEMSHAIQVHTLAPIDILNEEIGHDAACVGPVN